MTQSLRSLVPQELRLLDFGFIAKCSNRSLLTRLAKAFASVLK
jgi:hypothetical protein